MNRILLVLLREYTSTVLTRGFLLGVLLTPVLIGVAIGAVALVSLLEAPRVAGRFAVVDSSGVVGPKIADAFSTKGRAEAAANDAQKAVDAAEQGLKQMGVSGEQVKLVSGQIKDAAAKEVARSKASLTVDLVPQGADVESLRRQVRDAQISTAVAQGQQAPVLALAIVPRGSVFPADGNKYEEPELLVNPRLDIQIRGDLRARLGEATVAARLEHDPRVKNSGMSADEIRAILRQPATQTRELTAEGERASSGPLQMLIPVAFMVLLMISVMTGGQYLLTAVVEEKSSRVMEVLLSAVSPTQLMVGKVLGQMAVALTLLIVYGSVGIGGLAIAKYMDVLSWSSLTLFIIFFFLAFFTIASLMAAVGAAVNEMREAQTLLTPIMMIVMLPWLMLMPIQRAPNSSLATIASFVPGINPFVMVIRLGGSEPVPAWQIPVAIAVALVTAIFAGWAAGKIFRVGVLMYGKPPDLRTLIRWVRMA